MKSLITLWRFSRPHTIIGTVISISTLYVIASQDTALGEHAGLWLLGIITGICCNIFIVGINQVQDIEIDRINKPRLPLVTGELRIKTAWRIIYTCLVLALLISAYVSLYLSLVIAFALFMGWAYSMPPLHFKRHHLPAAIAVTTVRGFVVNLGGFMVFNWKINASTDIPWNVRVLTIFIIAFSIAISWFKDLPDVAGDARYRIKTLAILYSQKFALIAGNVIVISAYLFSLYVFYTDMNMHSQYPLRETRMLFYGHVVLSCLFLLNSLAIHIKDQDSIKKFYKRFWLFFFAEYLLYMLAFL
jgi:homogentisate phytyltransferase/homogentisate geranylgeranyltransferase